MTATLMNELFVSVKVDREERPDLDKFYQSAHAVLTRRTGGWPLTVFLNPETLVPFFAGTYFPKVTRYQVTSFKDVLRRISDVYKNDKDKTLQLSRQVIEAVQRIETNTDATDEQSDPQLIQNCRKILEANFDADVGGFGREPKFPQPTPLQNLVLHWALTSRPDYGPKDTSALDMVMKTLTRMARGGIYDQLGGGFFRYSTDRNWIIPHFEKMLNDNGLLLALYASAYQITPDDLFKGVIRDTADWLRQDMQMDHGGYRAAIDADSEGEEGRYYCWRRNEIKRLLTDDEYLLAETLYGLDRRANFESKWHLVRQDAWPAVVRRLSMDPGEAERLLTSCRRKLLTTRAQRIPPSFDNKVIASWNGYAIQGMAQSSLVLGHDELLQSAQRAMDFVRNHMYHDGQLAATWCAGKRGHTGFLDDYASILNALLTLLEVQWRGEDADLLVALADAMITAFYDAEAGGFWFTRFDQQDVIHRHKPLIDDAGPSSNGLACSVLIRLANLTGNQEYLQVAEHSLEAARAAMSVNAASHASLVNAMIYKLVPEDHVVIRGPVEQTEPWLKLARDGTFNPWAGIWTIPYQDAGQIPRYLPRLASIETQEQVTAYICRNMACSAPIRNIEIFKERLVSM